MDLSYTYLIAPLLLILVVIAAVWLDRFSVPVILVALGTGILFGSDVLNVWYFEDAALTNQIANVALVFILFQGGFSTKQMAVRQVALAAGGLATWGVILTALINYVCLRYLIGWPMEVSLLVAVILSSTDAAAIFSILRRQALPPRLASTLEVESAANDPMAILLTAAAVEMLKSGEVIGLSTVALFLWKFTAGPAIGWLIARGAVFLFNRLNPQERGYYYVLLVGVILLSHGVTELVHGSGMLAAFTAGFVMGNSHFIYKQGARNFSAALSTIANIGAFVFMGLLVFPHRWAGLWTDGLLLFAVLTFVARPLAVWIGTIGMGIPMREKHFISWAGLRGAVPIALATFPLAEGLPAGEDVFNLVFFAVILSVAFQGSTLGPVAKLLGLSTPSRPMPRYALELVTMAKSDLDLVVVDLPDPKGCPGPRIRDLCLPPGAVITLIIRDSEVLIPKGNTRLLGWDQVTVLAHAKDEEKVKSALLDPFNTPFVETGDAI
jgi:cell volume regulation protein A